MRVHDIPRVEYGLRPNSVGVATSNDVDVGPRAMPTATVSYGLRPSHRTDAHSCEPPLRRQRNCDRWLIRHFEAPRSREEQRRRATSPLGYVCRGTATRSGESGMEESEHLAVAMLFFSPANMKLDDDQHKMAWEKPVPTSRRTPVQHNFEIFIPSCHNPLEWVLAVDRFHAKKKLI